MTNGFRMKLDAKGGVLTILEGRYARTACFCHEPGCTRAVVRDGSSPSEVFRAVPLCG